MHSLSRVSAVFTSDSIFRVPQIAHASMLLHLALTPRSPMSSVDCQELTPYRTKHAIRVRGIRLNALAQGWGQGGPTWPVGRFKAWITTAQTGGTCAVSFHEGT